MEPILSISEAAGLTCCHVLLRAFCCDDILLASFIVDVVLKPLLLNILVARTHCSMLFVSCSRFRCVFRGLSTSFLLFFLHLCAKLRRWCCPSVRFIFQSQFHYSLPNTAQPAMIREHMPHPTPHGAMVVEKYRSGSM